MPTSEHACLYQYSGVYRTCVGHDGCRLGVWHRVFSHLNSLDMAREDENMARKVKDASLDSREARGKLKARGKPYWRTIERGLHLGYRKLKGRAGTWWMRHYLGEREYDVEAVGIADDLSDADGVAILDYWKAQTKARERMVGRAHAAAGKTGPFTVADAMDAYLEFLDNNRKSGSDARYRDRAFIRPKLGELEAVALTAERLRKWHAGLSKEAPRLRTKKGKAQKFRKLGTDDDSKRQRRASANRTLTILKAALNRAWRDGLVPSDAAWRRVEPFENVDAARVRYLKIPEAQRLINAASPHFRQLVQGALQTGARYGELARLTVADFDAQAGTVAVLISKNGKRRHVVLTNEGDAFFKQVCAGRGGNDLMFTKSDGTAWKKSHQSRPIADACERAKIKPSINFHVLRHTYASLSVMNGVPLLVIAKNLGHSDTRMVERHYGHLAPSYVTDAIRAGAPRFGVADDTNVVAIS
jgi:integrase